MPGVLQLGTADAPRPQAILQNLDRRRWPRPAACRSQPLVIEQGGAAGDALVRDWPAPRWASKNIVAMPCSGTHWRAWPFFFHRDGIQTWPS
jgi:hypothetical protein